ncbi:hypothetical protein BSP239C_03578 [Brevibacterium sp. 239c]|nr:hypothetical protein BSP239C_03578 [Brevibacterium sp. 239c]
MTTRETTNTVEKATIPTIRAALSELIDSARIFTDGTGARKDVSLSVRLPMNQGLRRLSSSQSSL